MDNEETNDVEVNVNSKTQTIIGVLAAAAVGYFVEDLVKKGVRAGFAALKNR